MFAIHFPNKPENPNHSNSLAEYQLELPTIISILFNISFGGEMDWGVKHLPALRPNPSPLQSVR